MILAVPVNSAAVGNIRYGGTEIHPSLSLSYRYDDNVYLNDGNYLEKVDDTIFIVTPALEIKRSHDERIYMLRYDANIYRYSNETKEDKETHEGTAFIDTRFPGGLKLKVRDTYIKTADPASSELKDMDERRQNLFQVALGSNVFDRLSFSLKYSNTIHDYEETAAKLYLEKLDRSESGYGGEFTLKLLPKTSFFIGYNRKDIVYDNVVAGDLRDSTSNSISLGVKGMLTAKSSLDFSIGYLNRDYEDDMKEDFKSVITSLTYYYQYSSYTRISLKIKRDITESFFSTGTDTYNYYTDNTISLSLPLRLSNKVSSNIHGIYGVNEYSESALGEQRTDYLYGAGIKFNYNIKQWLYVGIGYDYRERNSDLDTEDYQNNQYTANLTAEF